MFNGLLEGINSRPNGTVLHYTRKLMNTYGMQDCVLGARCSSVIRAFAHGAMGRRIDLSWCGMFYPLCGMMHIKEPLLLIGKSSPCGGSRFPLSLFEWSFTTYL